MSSSTESRLTGADIGVLVSYFVLVIGIGLFAMYRANRSTISGYFLAGRSMWFLPIGASLFVSNIGTEHFIGLAGSGAASGISVGAWELNALMILQMTGWIFIPVYISCGTYTMPEYLAKRFGGNRLRVYYAVLCLILYIFTKCSGDLYTGALFIQQALNWDLYVSIVLLIVITAVLTFTGGLTAVIYTDTLQATLMVGGALYLMAAGFYEIGGFSGLLEKYPQAVPTNVSAIVPGTTCHHPDKQAFRMLRGAGDDYMPWLGFLLGQTPGSIWYWCTDQVIVQRALAAKSISHAQGATLMAGFIKILPLFFMVMPGMISRILYPDDVACTNPDYCMSVCQSKTGCSNIAYPRLVLGLMPNGARGLMMAVIVAAVMSDLDSIFNSASTLFTIDIWKRIRKAASVTEQMIVGRVFIVVMVAVSIAWVPVIKETQRGQVFIYINEITNYLAPPFAAVFLLAVLVPRVNEKGVFWSLMYAFLVGVVRLFLVLSFQGEGYCGAPSTSIMPALVRNMHYMYFALFLFLSTGLIALVISYLTPPPPEIYIQNTTLWCYLNRDKQNSEDSENTDVDLKIMSADDIHEANTIKPGDGHVDSAMTSEDGNVEEKFVRLLHVEKKDPPSITRRVLNYVLGIGDVEEQTNDDQGLKDHMLVLAALKQTRLEKTILTIGLLSILSIGVAMFIFWSVHIFDTKPFYPEGAQRLLPGDEQFLDNFVNYSTLSYTGTNNNTRP
ncbi:sodium/myo-inositol cotransporter-like [Haliotis rufescens]|uniref:sodium/myo-inositol cotransporter-like n=1 Tax=Haliotis rufescens TaxID=6454 RepID=UPI00201EA15A|nr:sodium/myo-inositol cotransporter-like [Haliotis rufescens]XP_046336370.2 sodium/myo-inositol cotransporter-like [Haliotis rufescens]XP_046336371.2 sodium/myo-inositol cotransporter-like [Haliotis rufescens]XP_046336372.2 sodium/myo-inositol cotransporter-like [Haliotis rufescens]XP_048250331.1 sodium/myo-inositol cotransporter-like [Haliotis rufescens]